MGSVKRRYQVPSTPHQLHQVEYCFMPGPAETVDEVLTARLHPPRSSLEKPISLPCNLLGTRERNIDGMTCVNRELRMT